jgi:hypothetical protein
MRFVIENPLGTVGATIGDEGVDSLQQLRLSKADHLLVWE